MDYIHTVEISEISHRIGWLIFTKAPTDLFGQLPLRGYLLLVSLDGEVQSIVHNLGYNPRP